MVQILKPSRDSGRTIEWIVRDGLTVNPTVGKLVRKIGQRIAKLHKQALAEGAKADGSGEQVDLLRGAQKHLADQGLRPDVRGFRGKRAAFYRNLKMYKRPHSKATKEAEGRVGAPQLTTWLRQENDRGVEYFYTGGKISEAIDDEIGKWLTEVISGKK